MSNVPPHRTIPPTKDAASKPFSQASPKIPSAVPGSIVVRFPLSVLLSADVDEEEETYCQH